MLICSFRSGHNKTPPLTEHRILPVGQHADEEKETE